MSGYKIKTTHPSLQNIKVAVDCCIFTIIAEQLHILLIKMNKAPYKEKWALPGGLIKNTESIDHAASRILQEETGLTSVYLEQLYTFGEPKRDPFGRVISTAYFALIPYGGVRLQTGKKYLDVAFRPYDSLPKLAYDHDEIAKYAKQRLEWKLMYTNVVWSLLPARFTLTELQRVYEIVMGRGLDKRNFRKKIMEQEIIEKTGLTRMKGAHRPAMLYSFKSKKMKMVDMV